MSRAMRQQNQDTKLTKCLECGLAHMCWGNSKDQRRRILEELMFRDRTQTPGESSK